MKWIQYLLVLTCTIGILHAERVKTFDLNDQILDVNGKKVEKFKINDLTISTNLSLSENQDYYSAKEKGYFAIEFDKLENNLELNFKLSVDPYHSTWHIWRFLGDLGESQFIYVKKIGSNYTEYKVNGKVIKSHINPNTKIIVKNNKLTLYSNNEKVTTINISKLKGIKAVEFEDTQSVSDFFIIKDK